MAGHYYNGRELELLIPASSLEVLKIAVIFGADAVYIGGEAFGLRAKAKNFSKEDMVEGIKFAHERDVKVYVTANILAHNYDLDGAREYFKELDVIKPDAVIISDPGMFTIAKEELHDIDIHISTQANNTNYMTYQFWWKQGAKRVVTARELSLNEIRNIRKNIPDEMEIETYMVLCVYHTQEDVFLAVLWQEGTLTEVPAHILADGSTLLLRRTDQANICLYMRMKEELISLTLKIYV